MGGRQRGHQAKVPLTWAYLGLDRLQQPQPEPEGEQQLCQSTAPKVSFTDFKTEECSRIKVVAMVMNPIVSFKRWLALWIVTSHEIALNFIILLYLHMAASLPPSKASSMSLH